MAREHRMYLDGEWVEAADGTAFDDFNPYTGEVYAKVAGGKAEEARRAVDAAAAAFPAWSATPPEARRAYFLRAADILERRREEIASILTEETGATFGMAMFQCSLTPGMLREAASQVHMVTGQIIPANLPGAFFMALRQPVGVVAGIAPWNGPLILSLRAVAFPMAYGNTTVLKP